MILNDNDRLQLQKMIDANDTQDNTSTIREVRHSDKIRKDVEKFILLKKQNEGIFLSDKTKFEEICISQCSFIFMNYTDIYNKLLKDELNISILDKFLDVLKQIEDGKVDQHEGSVLVGELLKKIYIDSALRRSEKLDAEHAHEEKVYKTNKDISWRDYKKKTSA